MYSTLKPILIFILVLAGSLLMAQNAPARLEIKQDPRIDSLLVKYINHSKANPTLEGWRVQIYFESGNNSKTLATNARDRFIELFPEHGAYLSFNEPYYKVRVGDFRTRMDAEGFRQMIITEFPNAYVVPDKVMYDKLK